jgi:HAD superfamily hydrolase (TIGR01509 family)
MDDTLVATAPIWRDAEHVLLCTIGHPDFPISERCKGMNALDIASTAHRELSVPQTLEECQRVMRDRLLENFERFPIQPIPGAMELVRRCGRAGLPMAVASGSPMQAIEHALDTLGIRHHMQVLVSSESVARGKPHPDVFLATAEELGFPAANCLVFEDSLAGSKAAAAAGMQCIVRPSIPGSIAENAAMLIVSDWNEVPIHEILSGHWHNR